MMTTKCNNWVLVGGLLVTVIMLVAYACTMPAVADGDTPDGGLNACAPCVQQAIAFCGSEPHYSEHEHMYLGWLPIQSCQVWCQAGPPQQAEPPAYIAYCVGGGLD